MNEEKTDKILKILIYGCFMLTDECNPQLVDSNKTEKDVEAWQKRAIDKYQGRYEKITGACGSRLFYLVVNKMLHSIYQETTTH